MRDRRLFRPLILSVLAGCASSGTHPEDLSAAQHSAIASADEAAGARQARQYHANASQVREHCVAESPDGTDVCWTSIVNPTADHLRNAQRLYALAAQHRAESQGLRDAEATMCSGLTEPDRDTSPFIHRDDIQRVMPLHDPPTDDTAHVVGATVVFGGVRGLTPALLQRVLDCHMARSAVEGHDEPDMQFCPVAMAHVVAHTRALVTSVAVDIRSDDPAVAAEVLRRAQALVAPPPPLGTL